MNDEDEQKLIKKYHNKPRFDFLHKWEAIYTNFTDFYNNHGERTYPVRRETFILWKSQMTGKVVRMDYNYQVEEIKEFGELRKKTDDKE